jgi:hypothetical protein
MPTIEAIRVAIIAFQEELEKTEFHVESEEIIQSSINDMFESLQIIGDEINYGERK